MAFDSLRRPLGGFMRKQEPAPPVIKVVEDEAYAAALHRIEIIGRIIIRKLLKLEKKMTDTNVTIDQVLAAVADQKTALASMATLLAGMHARISSALSGELSATGQQKLSEVFAEIKGNTNAITSAVTTYQGDAVDPNAPPAGGNTAAAATTTQLQSSKAEATTADVVTLTAGVSAVNPTTLSITGSVTFGIMGGDDLGHANLDSTGVAVFNAPTTPGDYDIVATYSGDSNFAVSKSAVLEQSIVVPDTGGSTGAQGSQVGQIGGAQTDQGGSGGVNVASGQSASGALNPAPVSGDQPQQGGQQTGPAPQDGVAGAGQASQT